MKTDLERKAVIPKHQIECIGKHSTVDQVYKIKYIIERFYENKKYT